MSFLLALAVLGMTAIMVLAWLVQRAASNAGWIDVFWSFGAGAVLALCALSPGGAQAVLWRQALCAGLVGLWSARLGLHIASRVARSPEDARYAALRAAWGGAFQERLLLFALAQALAVAALALTVTLAARAPGMQVTLGDALGVAVLLVAVAGESVADVQLNRFKADPANRGSVCAVGLWAWSRHPNYFFEWLGWCAWPLIAFRAGEPETLSALAAPAMMFVLLRYGSGVPPLEVAMLASRGEAWRRYQAATSAFFPLPPKSTPEPAP